MFDPKNPVQTRDGRKAEIVKVLDKPLLNGETIIAIVEHRPEGMEVETYHYDGIYDETIVECSLDLINIPDNEPELWAVELFGGGYERGMKIFSSNERATSYANSCSLPKKDCVEKLVRDESYSRAWVLAAREDCVPCIYRIDAKLTRMD